MSSHEGGQSAVSQQQVRDFCVDLTAGQKVASQALIGQRLADLARIIEDHIQVEAQLALTKDKASLERKAKELFSKAKVGLGGFFGNKPSPVTVEQADHADEVELVAHKAAVLERLFKSLNCFLMDEIQASYIYVIHQVEYPQFQLAVDADHLIVTGDARSALIELKTFVSEARKFNPRFVREELRPLAELAVNQKERLTQFAEFQVDAVLHDAWQSAAAADGGASRSSDLSIAWNRASYFRPETWLPGATLGELRAPLFNQLGSKLSYVMGVLAARVGNVSTNRTPEQWEMLLEKKKAIAIKQSNLYLDGELESPYLTVNSNLQLVLSFNQIRHLGDVWYAAREIRLFAFWLDRMIENYRPLLDYMTPDHVKRETSRQLRLTFNQLMPSVLKKYEELVSQQAVPVEHSSAASSASVSEEKLDDALAAQSARQSTRPQAIATPRRLGGLDLYRYSDSEDEAGEAKEPEGLETQSLVELARELSDPTHVSALGREPDRPDLTVKLLVFGRIRSLTSALSFWSLLQGKTEKITRARYGLDLLKALLLDLGQDQALDQTNLLRDITDVLFCHRIRQVQGVGEQSVARSGQKFASLLLEPQNAYMRYVIFASMFRCLEQLVDQVEKQETASNGLMVSNSAQRGDAKQQIRTLFDKQREQRRYDVDDSEIMIRLLMVWVQLKYQSTNSRDLGQEAVSGLSHQFFASDRAPRLLLVPDAAKDQLIRTMRERERVLRRAR